MTGFLTSKDGTRIAYDRIGQGPAVILVDGALGYRGQFGLDSLAGRLADRLTAYTYDRRGRGESNDMAQERGEPRSLEREIEDLEALIDVAEGSAFLYGISSGAALVLEAAARLGEKVRKIALYEAPYNTDDAGRKAWREYTTRLGALLAQDRHGDAIALFMMLTGAPEEAVAEARKMPMWALMEAVAPTLAYDHIAVLGADSSVPVDRAAEVSVPTLILDGGGSYPFMHAAALALAQVIPSARQRTLDGQTHEVEDAVLAPVLVEFFLEGGF